MGGNCVMVKDWFIKLAERPALIAKVLSYVT